jgi:hypothetical protein
MIKFKVYYSDGNQICEAKDIFSLMIRLKMEYKLFFKMPVKIETLT